MKITNRLDLDCLPDDLSFAELLIEPFTEIEVQMRLHGNTVESYVDSKIAADVFTECLKRHIPTSGWKLHLKKGEEFILGQYYPNVFHSEKSTKLAAGVIKWYRVFWCD